MEETTKKIASKLLHSFSSGSIHENKLFKTCFSYYFGLQTHLGIETFAKIAGDDFSRGKLFESIETVQWRLRFPFIRIDWVARCEIQSQWRIYLDALFGGILSQKHAGCFWIFARDCCLRGGGKNKVRFCNGHLSIIIDRSDLINRSTDRSNRFIDAFDSISYNR